MADTTPTDRLLGQLEGRLSALEEVVGKHREDARREHYALRDMLATGLADLRREVGDVARVVMAIKMSLSIDDALAADARHRESMATDEEGRRHARRNAVHTALIMFAGALMAAVVVGIVPVLARHWGW